MLLSGDRRCTSRSLTTRVFPLSREIIAPHDALHKLPVPSIRPQYLTTAAHQYSLLFQARQWRSELDRLLSHARPTGKGFLEKEFPARRSSRVDAKFPRYHLEARQAKTMGAAEDRGQFRINTYYDGDGASPADSGDPERVETRVEVVSSRQRGGASPEGKRRLFAFLSLREFPRGILDCYQFPDGRAGAFPRNKERVFRRRATMISRLSSFTAFFPRRPE